MTHPITRGTRIVLFAAAGALALAFAGSAFSAINPRLLVGTTTQTGNSTTSIQAQVGASDDPLARLQVYLPSGVKLASPPGGVEVGSVSTTALSTQIGPGEQLAFKMTGTITAIPIADPAVSWENANCDPVTHLGAWMARVEGGGDAWTFPIFVDQTTGAEAQFGQVKLVACFKPLSLDSYGNKFVSMSLTLRVLGAPSAPGIYRWRSLWTPFTANAATLNQAGTVEAQSIARLQAGALTLNGTRSGSLRHGFALGGKLIVDGEPIGGTIVAIRHGVTRTKLVSLGSTKTNASGSFLKRVTVKKPQYFQAGATVGGQELGAAGCTASFGSAVPCVNATNARVALVSRLIRLGV